MLLWLILFFAIIAISFFLAYQSMRDFQLKPEKLKLEYSLFLIRNATNFNDEFLKSIHSTISSGGLIISIEKLFKGQRSALVIFGPKLVLNKFQSDLDLLELEDYSRKFDSKDLYAFETSKKGKIEPNDIKIKLTPLVTLADSEQFWWQLTLQAQNSKNKDLFNGIIRGVIIASEDKKRLIQNLSSIDQLKLAKIPSPYSNRQLLEIYRERILPTKAQNFSVGEILQLI